MTWEEVQKATLTKLFAMEDGKTDLTDWRNSEYVAAMPQAANEGIQYLCSVVPLRRSTTFAVKYSGNQTIVPLAQCAAYRDFGDLPEAYLLCGDGQGRLLPVTVLGNEYLVLPAKTEGHVLFFYTAWPQTVTADTADGARIDLDDDVAVLLPLYMAAELYKEQDATVATLYRNEFQVQLEALRSRRSGVWQNDFTSTTGWWPE